MVLICTGSGVCPDRAALRRKKWGWWEIFSPWVSGKNVLMSGNYFSHNPHPQKNPLSPPGQLFSVAEVVPGGGSEFRDICHEVALYLYPGKCFIAVAFDP